MKKIVSLLLVLAMAFSLCACGGSDDGCTSAKKSKGTVSLSLGEELDLGFCKMTFSDVGIGYITGSKDKGYISAEDGMYHFQLIGRMVNTSGEPIEPMNFGAQVRFNDEYTYQARMFCNSYSTAGSGIAPLTEADVWVYADVPELLLEQLKDAKLTIAYNDDLSYVVDVAKAKNKIEMVLDESVCAKVKDGPSFEMVYFEDCPLLPTPESFCPVSLSGSSKSTSNGVASRINVSFAPMTTRSFTMEELLDAYVKGITELGFEYENNKVLYNGVTLASIELQQHSMSFDIVPGNENVNSESDFSAAVEESEEKVYKLGETAETDKVIMTLEELDTNAEVRSGTGNYGTYKYYISASGDPYIALRGTFQNVGTDPVDISNMFISFCFDDKYNYRGDMTGATANTSFFVEEVGPLSTVEYYAYAEVPAQVQDSFESCVVRIGYKSDFGIKTVSSNGMPNFDYCEEVFKVEINR